MIDAAHSIGRRTTDAGAECDVIATPFIHGALCPSARSVQEPGNCLAHRIRNSSKCMFPSDCAGALLEELHRGAMPG